MSSKPGEIKKNKQKRIFIFLILPIANFGIENCNQDISKTIQ